MRIFAALSASVAAECSSASGAEVRLFLNALRQHFVLGITPEDGASLLGHLRAMPADLQMLWTDLLQMRLGYTTLTAYAHGQAENCRLPQADSRDLPQVVSSMTTAPVCNCCGSQHSQWRDVHNSSTVVACARQQAANIVPMGEDRETVYASTLEPLARVTKNCVVVDRYAGQQLCRSRDRSGVAWLARRLVASGVQRVVLVTASVPTTTGADISNAVRGLGDLNVRAALRVETRPDEDFKRYAHDRFILLQTGHTASTFSVGKGVDVFSRRFTTQETSLSSSESEVVPRILGQLGVDVSIHLA